LLVLLWVFVLVFYLGLFFGGICISTLDLDSKNKWNTVTHLRFGEVFDFLRCGKIKIEGSAKHEVKRCCKCNDVASWFVIDIRAEKYFSVVYSFRFFCSKCKD